MLWSGARGQRPHLTRGTVAELIAYCQGLSEGVRSGTCHARHHHMHGLNDPPELRVLRFEAEAVFSRQLCTIQIKTGLEATTADLLKAANEHGFSWQFMAAEPPYVEVLLRHEMGGMARATGTHPTAVLLGLLGCLPPDLFPSWMLEQERQEPPEAVRSVVVTPEPAAAPAPEAEPEPEPAPAPSLEAEPAPASAPAPVADAATAAAESLAAATAGEVIPEAGDRSAEDPLTDAEKATAKAMIKGMAPDQRRQFTIAFRHAFRVPAEQTAIAPLIVQFKHLDFIDRFTGEAAGLVRP